MAGSKDRPDVRGQYKFASWISAGKTYKQAWGWLGMPHHVALYRSTKDQKQVSGGTGDDAGHLIGNRFGAPGGVDNLSLQNSKTNRYGTYKDLENMWERKRLNKVDVWVQVTDVTRFGEVRPFMRNVKWTELINGNETTHEVDFANTHTALSRLAQNIAPTIVTVDAEIIRVDFRKKERLS